MKSHTYMVRWRWRTDSGGHRRWRWCLPKNTERKVTGNHLFIFPSYWWWQT